MAIDRLTAQKARVLYLKRLQMASHNLTMELPGNESEYQQMLEPDVLYWEVQAICHFVNRLMTKATIELNRAEQEVKALEDKK